MPSRRPSVRAGAAALVIGHAVMAHAVAGSAQAPAAPAARPDGGAVSVDAGARPQQPSPDGPAGSAVVGPAALAPIEPVYPEEAIAAGAEGDVILILTISETGDVTQVDVEQGQASGLTEAAIEAAGAARFRPAADARGRPVAVRIRWVMHFTLPTRTPVAAIGDGGADGAAGSGAHDGGAEPDGGAPDGGAPDGGVPDGGAPDGVTRLEPGRDGMLALRVRQKGTGKPLTDAVVYIEDLGELIEVDDDARMQRAAAPGAYALVIRAPGHVQEERLERVRPGERLDLTVFIEKDRLNPYESIVRAPRARAETGVVSLEGAEIHQIPGTFGDPFRAVMLLPGVSSPLSGLGYPVVRGQAPGATGTFVDGVRVPLLYHVGFGPAVIHPMFLQGLDFHAGGFPAEFGRFTAGLIHAHTIDAPTERRSMAEVDLFKFSGFHGQPLKIAGREGAVAAAARYGTLTFLARAIDPHAVLEYWDYQLRTDMKLGPGTLRLLVFGAKDTVGERSVKDENGIVSGRDQLTRIGFHRADLRYRAHRNDLVATAGVEVGNDFTIADADPDNSDGPVDLDEFVVRPRLTLEHRTTRWMDLRGGGDVLFQSWSNPLLGGLDILGFPRRAVTYGAFVQAQIRPTTRLLLAPGVRLDHYRFEMESIDANRTGIDPRISARYQIRGDIHIKGGVGLYQAPPRFLVPWPAIGPYGLEQYGLNQSIQTSAGVEVELPEDLSVDGQLYYANLPRVAEAGFEDPDTVLNTRRKGRAYGLELIARRHLGRRLFGWLTYSLARAEREYADAGWRPTDFDQTHVVNTVLSYALGRAWTISGTFHMNSGRPQTPGQGGIDNGPGRPPDTGEPPGPGPGPDTGSESACRRLKNSDRLDNFWRIDARIEKREAFDTWYLDFYVDWFNVSLQREITAFSYENVDCTSDPPTWTRYKESNLITIPTIGLRAVF